MSVTEYIIDHRSTCLKLMDKSRIRSQKMRQRHKCLESCVAPLAASGIVNTVGEVVTVVAARLPVGEGALRIETVFNAVHPRYNSQGVTVKSAKK